MRLVLSLGLLVSLVVCVFSVEDGAYEFYPSFESNHEDIVGVLGANIQKNVPYYRQGNGQHLRPTITQTETSWHEVNHLTTATETLLETSISTTFLTTSTTTLVTLPVSSTTIVTTKTFSHTVDESCTVSTTACESGGRRRLSRPIVYYDDEQFIPIAPSAVQGVVATQEPEREDRAADPQMSASFGYPYSFYGSLNSYPLIVLNRPYYFPKPIASPHFGVHYYTVTTTLVSTTLSNVTDTTTTKITETITQMTTLPTTTLSTVLTLTEMFSTTVLALFTNVVSLTPACSTTGSIPECRLPGL